MASQWEVRLRQWLTPPGFFLGLALGLVFCCVAGRKAPDAFPFTNFTRLHYYLSPQSLYRPTALQVRAVARRELPRDKIAVIIGGNSILQGYGQMPDHLWNTHLQRQLGDEYRVLNLAVAGGAPNEFGQLTAEMLSRERSRIIYVCNCNSRGFAVAPDGNNAAYRYFYQDACARGLLLPFSEREKALAALEPRRRDREGLDEQQLQLTANRVMSFNDLWQVVGYEYFFTVWEVSARWQARKRVADVAPVQQPRFANWDSRKKNILSQGRQFSAKDWDQFDLGVRQAVPEPLRSKTLAVIHRDNPVYLQKIDDENPGFLAGYDRQIEIALKHLQACGLNSLAVGTGYDESDYLDHHHLVDSGGVKLADELAPVILEQARRLGYLAVEQR